MERSNFINVNGHIVPKPDGIDCNLEAGKVYSLIQDHEDMYIEADKDFEFPETYYQADEDKKFVTRALNTFKNTNKLTTGVLLSGLKGSGKTLLAKKLAKESNLPIIVVNSKVYAGDIEGFFAHIETDVCVILDEIDKYWNTSYLLGFLDGVKPSCKKLVICTCNDEKKVSDCLNDRCSRIRYKKTFKGLTKEIVAGVFNDVLKDEKKANDAADYFYNTVDVISYDNVIIFAEEMKNNPDDSFEDVMKFLNISKR